MSKIYGNKANNLVWLRERPIYVPGFFILDPEDCIIDYENKQNEIKKVLVNIKNDVSSLNQRATEIEEIINSANTRANNLEFLKITQDYIFRTSASKEDEGSLSFAGMYTSIGPIQKNNVDLEKIIKTCWKSIYSKRVLNYFVVNNLNFDIQNFSIIVQEFFISDFAGVAFVDDVAGIISIEYGQEGAKKIVDGEKSGSIKIKYKSEKDYEISGGEAIEESVLFQLIKTLLIITKEKGNNQDIEWGIKKEVLAIFQTRDITVNLNNSDEDTIFDNTNISESYPGVTLPLTYSFILNAYSNVYISFLNFVGLNKKEIDKHDYEFRNLLGYVRGRVYYNIRNWYQMIQVLPGYRFNKDYFESMLNPEKNINQKKKRSLFQVIFVLPVAIKFIFRIFRSDSYIRNFVKKFERRYKHFLEFKLDQNSPIELLKLYERIEKEFFFAWSVPILNDFKVMIFQGITRKIIEKMYPGENYNFLISNLLLQDEKLYSLKPIKRIEMISKKIKEIVNLVNEFKGNKTNEEIYNEINSKNEYLEIKKLIELYISDFGDRNPSELKLESPNLKSNPGMLMGLLRNFVLNYDSANTKKQNSEFGIEKFKNDVSKKYRVASLLATPIYLKIINVARKAIADREEMRLLRSKAFNLARQIFVELGSRLVAKDLIEVNNQVFLLTRDELISIVRGHFYKSTIRDIIKERETLFEIYKNESDPSRRFSVGEFPDLTFKKKESDYSKKDCLEGIAASAGIVKGEAVCMIDFDENVNLKDKILVTRQTDPGWTIIFPLIKGLVTEKGNILSHAAIVSRELGIPSVVAIEGVLDIIKTGDVVEINGNTGVIKIIS